MISAQNFSSSESNSTSLLPVNVALTSYIFIDPVLSLSNSWKASLSRSGASKLFFFIDATIHSVNSISPLPSKSTSSNMASTMAASSPTAWKPYYSSSRVILPELLVLICLNAFSSSWMSSSDAKLRTMYWIVACCSRLPLRVYLARFSAASLFSLSFCVTKRCFSSQGSASASYADIRKAGFGSSSLEMN